MTATTMDLNDNLKTMRKALADTVADNEQIIGSVKTGDEAGVEGVGLVVEPAQKDAFQANLARIKELRGLIDGVEQTLAGKDFLAEPDPLDGKSLAVIRGALGDALGDRYAAAKSVGQMFVESDEFRALDAGKAGYTMRQPWAPESMADLPGKGRFGRKDVYSALPSGSPSEFGSVTRDPMVGRAHRSLRVRDLFNVQQTTSKVIEYFRVTGFTNNASPVAERDGSAFAAKPQSTLTFVGESATVRTIAHYEAAHRNVLADEPQLRGIIDTELLYGLQLVEDDQILNGAGTSEDLEGILNVSGIQSYAQSSGPGTDNKADAIRRAMTVALLAYYEPTGIVLHDSDLEDIELSKDDNGAYLFLTALALGVEPRIHRLPVVSTPAIASGTGLVGAFGLGAQLYDREQPSIRIAEQHSDFFVRNAVVVLAEERLALATKRPEAFVEVTFS